MVAVLLSTLYNVLLQTSINAKWKNFFFLSNSIAVPLILITGAAVCCLTGVILMKKNDHTHDVTFKRNKKALKRVLSLNAIILVLSIPASVIIIVSNSSLRSKDYKLLSQHLIVLNFIYSLTMPYSGYSSVMLMLWDGKIKKYYKETAKRFMSRSSNYVKETPC